MTKKLSEFPYHLIKKEYRMDMRQLVEQGEMSPKLAFYLDTDEDAQQVVSDYHFDNTTLEEREQLFEEVLEASARGELGSSNSLDDTVQ